MLKLYAKMMTIQKENLAINKDSKNPFYKSNYISLDNLVSVLTPFLNKLDLFLYHKTENKEVKTTIVDIKSGEEISSSFPMIDDLTPQKLGSCISYWKRYNIGQLFNIITDRDDDWNVASEKVEKAVKKDVKIECKKCKTEVSKQVARFSYDKYGKVLCLNCQKWER